VCTQLFTVHGNYQPLVLACGHTLCLKCVDTLAKAPVKDSDSTTTNWNASSEHSACADSVQCVFCRRLTLLSGCGGVQGLARNTLVIAAISNAANALNARFVDRGGDNETESKKEI
jgi:hypothetical protein